jgi:hypothetical protein
MKTRSDALSRVRESRHRISEQVGHDPEKLVAYYIELQKKYKDRLVGVTTQEDRREEAIR